MKRIIAIVDDELDILNLVALHLKKSGFDTREFSEAHQLLDYLKVQIPSLIILDLMLPDMDGLDLCKYLKSQEIYSNIPVIMLTAKAEETDKVVGLEIGADDYITKPFSPRELVARVKAVLRRSQAQETSKIIELGKVKIDIDKHEVYVDDRKIDLTPTEFKILSILAGRLGWVFSREKLLEELWGYNKFVSDRTIDVHIKNIRDKLGEAGKYIKNVRGIGYKFDL